MDKVFKEEFEKPMIHFVKNANEITKVFFIALLYQFHNKNNKFIDESSLFFKINSLLK